MLRFTPYAWAKLWWFCYRGDTEVGGFGVTSLAPDPGETDPEESGAGDHAAGAGHALLIVDFVTVKQEVSLVSVHFEDEAVADFFEDQVDQGRKPDQFARIWLHTHPGDCPNPSGTDEETFKRVFGRCDWAVMFILAKGGQTYARMKFNVGPGGQCELPVGVDFLETFQGADHEAWEAEYQANIHVSPAANFGAPAELIDELDWDTEWLRQIDPTIELDELEQLARDHAVDPDELEELYDSEVIE